MNRAEVSRVLEREYPEPHRTVGIGGTVVVHFFITEQGEVRNALVADSSGLQPLDDAALRVVEVARFTPAYNRSEPVPVWIQLPITFEPVSRRGGRGDAAPAPDGAGGCRGTRLETPPTPRSAAPSPVQPGSGRHVSVKVHRHDPGRRGPTRSMTSQGAPPMRVQQIHQPEDFDDLKESWRTVYRSDPHTSIFASWGWLRGWIDATPSSWSVLAAIPHGSRAPVAFLPLRVENGRGRLKIREPAKLLPGGHPLADKSALVCAPECQADALPALARAVTKVMRAAGATELGIPEAADPRWRDLASALPGRRFTLAEDAPTPCPLLPLPETWEAYIQGSRKRRAALKHAEEEGFLVTHADAATLDRDIDVFLDLHQLRLGPKSPSYLRLMRSLVEWTFRSGILHMVTLWSDEGEPMASNVAFLDHHRGVFHAYNGGWDDWFRDRSPRRVAELYSIRWAIEHGFKVYDFGRGDEQYKFGFGAREGFNANLAVHRRTAVGTARRLASRVS